MEEREVVAVVHSNKNRRIDSKMLYSLALRTLHPLYHNMGCLFVTVVYTILIFYYPTLFYSLLIPLDVGGSIVYLVKNGMLKASVTEEIVTKTVVVPESIPLVEPVEPVEYLPESIPSPPTPKYVPKSPVIQDTFQQTVRNLGLA